MSDFRVQTIVVACAILTPSCPDDKLSPSLELRSLFCSSSRFFSRLSSDGNGRSCTSDVSLASPPLPKNDGIGIVQRMCRVTEDKRSCVINLINRADERQCGAEPAESRRSTFSSPFSELPSCHQSCSRQDGSFIRSKQACVRHVTPVLSSRLPQHPAGRV